MNLNSKIYIAGHRGLVGSAIWQNLQSKGYKNLIGKTSKELDLLDQRAAEKFFADELPEYVFLAAARVGGIMANNTYRADFLYENLMIQNNVIHSAWKYGVKKLMFLGSTCIYPKEAPQPMKEDALLTSPLEYTNESYAIAKIAGIKLCESFNLQYGTNFISVMPTNLYGPNDNFDLEKSHVLAALLRKIHLGKCLEDNNWEAVRKDLNHYPVEGTDGDASCGEILNILNKYGVVADVDQSGALVQDANKKSGSDSSINVSVEIWGSGKPLREFLWSEEMADACVFLMERVDFKDVIPKEVRELFKPGNRRFETDSPAGTGMTAIINNHQEIRNTHINVGTGKEISVKALAELIAKTAGFKGKLAFNSSKPDGTMRKLTDVSKLHELGWHHKTEIEEGIQRIYEWYVNQ
jgi:GDP-L-fucose synthase